MFFVCVRLSPLFNLACNRPPIYITLKVFVNSFVPMQTGAHLTLTLGPVLCPLHVCIYVRVLGCGSRGCECWVTLVSINLHIVPGVRVLAPLSRSRPHKYIHSRTFGHMRSAQVTKHLFSPTDAIWDPLQFN